MGTQVAKYGQKYFHFIPLPKIYSHLKKDNKSSRLIMNSDQSSKVIRFPWNDDTEDICSFILRLASHDGWRATGFSFFSSLDMILFLDPNLFSSLKKSN